MRTRRIALPQMNAASTCLTCAAKSLAFSLFRGGDTRCTNGVSCDDDDAFQLFLQKQKRAYGHIPVPRVIRSFRYTLLSTQQCQFLAPDLPCAQHVQSTRRMNVTSPRPSPRGCHLNLWGYIYVEEKASGGPLCGSVVYICGHVGKFCSAMGS